MILRFALPSASFTRLPGWRLSFARGVFAAPSTIRSKKPMIAAVSPAGSVGPPTASLIPSWS